MIEGDKIINHVMNTINTALLPLKYLCSSYLAYLRNNTKETKLIKSMELYVPDDDWDMFGFAVAGPLKYTGLLDENFNIKLSSSEWIKDLFNAIRDPENNIYANIKKGTDKFSDNIYKDEINNKNCLQKFIIKYLENCLTPKQKDILTSLTLTDKYGDRTPISPRGKICFGIINQWPGCKSAEREVVARIITAAENVGVDCIPLSPYCYILNKTSQESTGKFISPDQLDFVITTHYDSYKAIDSFYYHTLWNPPEIPLNLPDYSTRITNNYIQNDDFLIYDDGGMSDHLRCMLIGENRTLEGSSYLTASFPKSAMMSPKLDNPKMFYCGMNWECVVNGGKRHGGLFKLLDKTGVVKFYGPKVVKEWGNMQPWKGYKSYVDEIPFDGFSILQRINECGICLVLSSDGHRRAGAVTNRLYEACTAGAVIISDDNPFMLKYFSDAALFIKYNKKDPGDTYSQIMEKYNWIVTHKDEALNIAKRAQQIFLDKFALEEQLKQIIKNHSNRLQTVSKDLFACDEKSRIAVGFVLNTLDKGKAEVILTRVIDNVVRQKYRNIDLLIAADKSISDFADIFCKSKICNVETFGLDLFDFKKSRIMTNCEALHYLYSHVDCDYFMSTTEVETWFTDHVTTLIRTIKDNAAEVAYSGRNLLEHDNLIPRNEFFGKLNLYNDIRDMNYPNWNPCPGQFLFSKNCNNYIPDFMRQYLDGEEHYALIALSCIKTGKIPIFTQRTTFSYNFDMLKDSGINTVVSMEDQRNIILDLIKRLTINKNTDWLIVNDISNINENEVTQIEMRNIAQLPLKRWNHLRILRILKRIIPEGTGLYKKLNDKYEKLADQFINYFTI